MYSIPFFVDQDIYKGMLFYMYIEVRVTNNYKNVMANKLRIFKNIFFLMLVFYLLRKGFPYVQ